MRSLPGVLALLALATTCPAQAPDWTLMSPTTTPPARNGHAMVYDSARQRVVLFGGNPGNMNDTWEYDGRTWIRMSPATSPPGRNIHAMVYDSRRRRTVLFGGSGPRLPRFNDTWEWDGVNWTRIPTANAPSPRGGHAMAFNFFTGRTVMMGGTPDGSCAGILAGTWEYDGANWTQVPATTAPAPRARYGISSHGVLQRTLVFGGLQQGGCTRLNDTWEWDGRSWTQLQPAAAPPVRGHFAMADDTFRERVVLFGGSSVPADTWEWDGTTWTQIATRTTPPRTSAHAMAYDSVRQRVVMFAGSGNAANTWEYGPPITLSANPATISIANGGTQTLSIDVGSGFGNRAYWLFGSMTGTTPGVGLLGFQIPLNPDPYTTIAIGATNSAVLKDFKRTLSAAGTATASLNVPATQPIPPGFRLYHACVVYDAVTGGFLTVSNPVSVEFR